MLIFSVLGSNCIGLYANAASEDAENEVNEIVGNTRASPRLAANYDQVCMGGGWKNDTNGNDYQTGKRIKIQIQRKNIGVIVQRNPFKLY